MSAAEDITTQARMVRIDELDQSPTNPRRQQNSKADAELLDSVKKHGVLQPVLARPKPDGRLELVFGSRRLRAAQGAGRTEIPAMVRAMSDLEVLEAQLVENAQRADIDPIDEAEAYRRLHVEHGKSVEEIAAKVGKSKGTVYARLKLCDLVPEVQKALRAGKIETSIALLLARIPPTLQPEALKQMKGFNGEPISYRSAVDIVQHDFMLRLSEAGFDITDANLVPAAGACAACPKRTGNQRELFADVKSADVCTDPVCFKAKSDAAWKLKAVAARLQGKQVLEGKAAAKATRYGSGYVKLNDHEWVGGKKRTYRSLVGKEAPTVLARSERGEVVELARKADVEKALRAKGVRTQRDESHHTGRDPAQDQARKRELELGRQVLGQLAARAPQFTNGLLEGWRWLARAAVEAAWHDSLKLVVARRGLERALSKEKHGPKHEDYPETLFRWINAATVADAQGLAVEVLCARSLHSLERDDVDDTYGRANQAARLACDLAGVDVAALRAVIKAEDDAKRKAQKPKVAKKPAAKATKASKKKAAALAKRLAKASRGGEEAFAQAVGELHGCRPKKKAAKAKASKPPRKKVQTCRACGCTNADCRQCIAKTGAPCTWVAPDLCSACEEAA